MAADLHRLGAAELSRRLAAGDLTARALAGHLLARAEANRDLGAFNSVDADDVLRQADASDARRRAGAALGPLDGVPVAVNVAAKSADGIAGIVKVVRRTRADASPSAIASSV